MPIYEYVCPICHTRFERLRPVALRDMPTQCPQGHADCRRVPSRVAAFSKDEFGDVAAIGRGESGIPLSESFDCESLWSRDPVLGWDYRVDPETGNITICDETTPPL